MDAKLSVFSYLISLLPAKILNDLGLRLSLLQRRTASWTPVGSGKGYRELILRSQDPAGNQKRFPNSPSGPRISMDTNNGQRWRGPPVHAVAHPLETPHLTPISDGET